MNLIVLSASFSLLQYSAAMDPDHLDIYGDPGCEQQYAMKIDPGGWCIAREELNYIHFQNIVPTILNQQHRLFCKSYWL